VSWQKDIGTRFEHQVKDRFNALANGTDLTAVRIWYSGAGDREPFDVGVYRGEVRRENLMLQIEAKRTQGRSLGVLLSWLEKVAPEKRNCDHVVMFAVGRRNPVPIYVIHDGNATRSPHGLIQARDGTKSVSIHQRWVDRAGKMPFNLMAAGKTFVVEDFDEFCKHKFGLPKEV